MQVEELRKRQVLDIVRILGFPEEKINRIEEALAKHKTVDEAMEEINVNEKGREIAKIIEKIDEPYEPLKIETITALGKKRSLHIIDFHENNWIDISHWIMTEYKKEVRNSLLFFHYCTVFRRI